MGKGVNVPTINERFMGMRPSGYITSEDQMFLDRLFGTGNEQIESGVGQQQSMARSRLAQRRIGGPAAEQIIGDIGASGSLARSRLAGSIANIGHGIYSGNQAFERGKINRAWDAELQAHSRYDQRRQAQQAAWGSAIGSLAGVAGKAFGASLTSSVPGTDISPGPADLPGSIPSPDPFAP